MHVSQTDLAQGVTFDIYDKQVRLLRSLDNLRRVESAVGAAHVFALRVDARAATHAEIVRVYLALLDGALDAPARPVIESWVFERGARHADLAMFVYSLSLGADELDTVIAARNLAAGKRTEDDASRRPFVPTAGPTGQSYSASPAASAGRPTPSGAPPFTN